MDTEEILERLGTKIKKNEIKENIKKRAEEIRKRLEKEVNKGRYTELKKIGADLKDIAQILAYTENEASFVREVIKKQRTFKNDPENFGKRMEKTRMRILFTKRSGKYEDYHRLPVEERKKELGRLRKYSEWYLNRVILDLGAYFEALSPPNVKQAEERRQYKLIAGLLYDFVLFKLLRRAE